MTNNNRPFFYKLISIIIISCIIIQIVSLKADIESDISTEKHQVKTLRGESEHYASQLKNYREIGQTNDKPESKDSPLLTDQPNRPMNFAIGSQEGTGGGSYNVYESFNWTDTENINTKNSIGAGTIPTSRDDSITITTPTDFSKAYSYFNLSNIQAEEDWRLEDGFNTTWTVDKESWNFNYEEAGDPSYDYWNTIAISFRIDEDFVNISGIMTHHAGTADVGNPSGELWIEGNSGGQPNGTKLLQPQTLDSASNWNQYLFSPIVLTKGEYFVVMNDTDTTSNSYFTWRVTGDADSPLGDGTNDTKVVAKYPNYDSNWVEPQSTSYDAPLQIKVQPVEKNSSGYWVPKKYNLTNDLKIWYNTTANGGSEVLLDDSTWFQANDSINHLFKSNTSVSFGLNFVANYTCTSYPFSPTSSYLISNNSVANWNLTFSTTALNTTYNIRNHIVKITGIETDWKGACIYWNDTLEYSDLDDDENITLDGNPSNKYFNGSSIMVVNASTLAENATWHVWFDAPNYISDFNMSLQPSGTLLDLPFQVHTMNDYNFSFVVGETGNLTYWIDYPNGSQLLRQNVDNTNTNINDTWDIDSTFDSTTQQNGTYQLQAFWNNSDLTKVGTYTRNVTMFINTSFNTVKETEVIIGQDYNITAYYTSDHNSDTDLLNALIWCEVNWTSASDKWMTQNVTDDSYNASFSTSGETEGTTGNLTIITKTPWFENWTETIIISFVAASSIDVNTSSTLSLEWRENATLAINYSKSSDGSGINPGAIFDIDGSMITPTWDGGDEVYRFEFNSTDYNGEGLYPNINITASHSSYLDQTWTFNLTITPGLTNITASNLGIVNNTAITIPYAASSADSLIINLGYYHNLTFPLDNKFLVTAAPSVNSLIPSSAPFEEGNNSWTISFDPDETGVFTLEISFTLGNYTDALFVINLTVEEANTRLQTIYMNNTQIDYNSQLIFTLFFNNTGYNENITFGGSGPISINDSSITFLIRVADEYRFEIASTPIPAGLYTVNITFEVQYYKSDSIIIVFEIISDTVFADHSSNLVTGVTNASVISGNSLDFWIVWETEYGTAIVDSDVESNDTAVVHTGYNPGNGTHYFTFTAGSIGIIHINLTFNRSYVYDLNLTLHFEITDRGLVIANEPLTTHQHLYLSPTNYLQYGDRYYFYVFINDSVDNSPLNITVLDISTSTNVTFVNITIEGRHLFYFDAWIIAKSISTQISIQFNKLNYASVGYQISFFVDYADSEFQSAPPSVNTYYTQNLNFSLIWQKTQNPNAPFTPFIGINNTGSSQSSPYVEFKEVNNGNYTFQINAIQAGTYVVTLEFISSVFQNLTHQITINIYQIPTEFEFGMTTYSNNTLIGASGSLFNYSEIHTFEVTWNDSFSNSGIQDSSTQFFGNGSSYLNLTNSYPNGSHIFTINATTLGFYYVTIRFETTNFGSSIYGIYFNISTMLTLSLNRTNFVVNDEILDSVTIEILVERNISLFGYGYQTYKGDNISLTENDFTIWMNGTSVNNLNITIDKTEFTINFTTLGYQWGTYNLTFTIAPNGYQSRTINVTINLLGRSITLTVSLPVTTINQGESIEISAALEYASLAGIGAGVTLASLAGVDIDFYIGLIYPNGTKYFEYTTQTDASGDASYIIDGRYTQSATGFANITVMAASSFSGLPSRYSMSSSELGEYKIVKFLNPLEILLPAAIILIILVTIVGSVYVVNRRRKTRVATRVRGEQKVEQSFEDIKSIRLILARHESGLQFYSESTIADLATDTDALSGMSAAISSFMEEVSGSMASRSGEVKPREIEMMSREGLHMLIWHGTHSSLIIISEVRLPDYFQERLKKLGNTLEKKYEAELLNFYSSDQIPSSVVKKMVRNFIPLHYFSAFILNEGVLTLESIKLSGKERKMLKYMKEIQFVKEGIQFFFSEQIISQLSKKWKRSEAIKFLNKSIDLNLLIEASQEDLLDLQK